MKRAIFTAGFAALLTACAENPATGKNELSLMSPAQERQIGAREHPKILQAFGGVYDEGNGGLYVASVGGRLVANSELKGQPFRFTLLDSPVVNAFALPGGYVYITRGLMALANDEAELASVLGHEIGHVTARHGAQRQTRSTLVGILALGLGVALQNDIVNQVSQVAGAYYISSYSRGQEYEADGLGVRYLGRTGYDPYGAPRFLGHMDANTNLQAQLAGKEGRSNANDFFSTHPPAPDRVQRARAQASKHARANAQPANRDAYLDVIDGMIYGDSPDQGFVRNRKFLHPKLKFGFEVPQGFVMSNSSAAVVASGPNNAAIQFDAARIDPNMSTAAFIQQEWVQSIEVRDMERITVNGVEAATGWVEVSQGGESLTVRLVAYRVGRDSVHRFLMMAPSRAFASMAESFRRATYSYRKLGDTEAANLKPYRLRVVTVRRGDTVRSLAARMPFQSHNEDRFLVLNGLRRGAAVQAGQRVKIVTEH
ncbi:MAG: M48 family metalloprotease [Alphaproteobacteria bacterium]